MLFVRVLGSVHASIDGRPINISSRKALAVLGYLAVVDGHRENRERLTGLLWSEASTRNAQDSLRQIVRELNVALGDAGYSGHQFQRQTLSLRPDTISVDILDVMRRTEARGIHPLLIQESRLADRLFASLEDLDPAFREWLLPMRRIFHDRLVRELVTAMRAAAGERMALQVAEALFNLDPLSEEACRLIMRARAAEGDNAGAQRVYAVLYQYLSDELDAEPSIATQEVYAEVKLGRFDPPSQKGATNDGGAVRIREVENSIHAYQSPGDTRDAPDSRPRLPSVAILPFVVLSNDSDDSYLGTGIVEDLVAALSCFDELAVISRNSTLLYSGREVDVRQVGKDLGVRYVLSGVLRRQRQRLRVAVELADARGGSVIWAQTYNFAIDDVFEVQDGMVRQLTSIVAPRVRDAEIDHARVKRPENMDAYDHMLRGLDLLHRLHPSQFTVAREHFAAAIELDERYATAYALIGEWHSLNVGQGWSFQPESDRQSAIRFSEMAVDLDPSHVRALTMLGHDRAFMRREYDEAIALFDHAIAISPGSARVWALSSPTYSYIGDGEESISRTRRALSLSPRDLFSFRQHTVMSIAHYTRGEYDEAVRWGRISLTENPRYTATPRFVAASLVALGKLGEARKIAKKVLEFEPSFRVSEYAVRCPYRDPAARALLCERLSEAGLPA